MALASRIFSILLGLAVVGLLLWPINIPLGFGQAWWAREIAAKRQTEGQHPASEPAPAPSATAALPAPAEPPTPQVQQAAPAQQPHAISDPAAPKPNLLASEKAEAERLAALQKDKEAAAAPPPKLYYKVHVVDAGTIEAGGTVITLAGITARAAQAKCKDGRGKNWACGAAARVALTKLIRSRAVSCVLPKEGERKAFAARCSVAGIDLSTWVVRQGWANPKERQEQALAEAEDAAKKDKVGLWRGSW